ncbi:MAG: hypothetical protein ACI3Y5_01175 [Prevotella sp.]
MKRIILSFLALGMTASCLAAADMSLLIRTAGTEHAISLAEISRVTYTETDMVVVMSDGTTRAYAMSAITSMTFGNADSTPSAISKATAETEAATSIYTLDGAKADRMGQKGVYIIKVGKETRKVKK